MIRFLFLLSLFCSLLSQPAAAEDMSLYDADISVDVTAATASAARETAMNEANRQAVMTVARRLTTAEGASVLNHLNNNQILNFIKEVTVGEEKVSDIRYIANLKITINAEIIKAYLSEKNAPVAIVEESTIIIIPTFREFATDTPLLWEENNPWLQAWNTNAQTSGPVKILPLGNTYANSITAAQALQMNGIALDGIAAGEQTPNLYIADAIYDGIDGLDVTLYAYKNGSQETVKIPGSRGEQLFNDAVRKVKETLLAKVQRQSQTVSQSSSEITVLFAFNALRDWMKVQQALKNTAGVDSLTIDALGAGKVQFKLRFTGGEDRLLHHLRDKNLNLKPYGSFYNLERF